MQSNMQSYVESDLHFSLDGLDPLTGSFNGIGSSQEFQGYHQWPMSSPMTATNLASLYESDKMAPHVQAMGQSQAVPQAPFVYHRTPATRQTSLLTQQLAAHVAHPKIHVQGFDTPQNMTVDPNALNHPAASPMRASLLSPQMEQMGMDLDFPTLSPRTPSDVNWSNLSTQPIPIPSTSHISHIGVGSFPSTRGHLSGSFYSPSPYAHDLNLSMTPMSPIQDMAYFESPSSYQAASDSVGFAESQIPAVQNIRQYQAMHPGNAIPAALITSELAEVGDGKGWCLIGTCGVERAMNKANPTYDPACDKKRKRLDHLYDHIRDKHFGCRPHQCFVCFNTFAREHDLKRHEKTHQSMSLPCSHCDKVYTRKDNLQRHIDTKHPDSAPTKSCAFS